MRWGMIVLALAMACVDTSKDDDTEECTGGGDDPSLAACESVDDCLVTCVCEEGQTIAGVCDLVGGICNGVDTVCPSQCEGNGFGAFTGDFCNE